MHFAALGILLIDKHSLIEYDIRNIRRRDRTFSTEEEGYMTEIDFHAILLYNR